MTPGQGGNLVSNSSEWTRYRSQAKARALLAARDEHDLLARAKAGDRAATRVLVDSHMRMVVQVASRYARDGLSVQDLVSEGVLGLLEAIRRFELERGSRFASYAAWWVRAFVRLHALSNRRIVGIPDTRGARLARSRLRSTERMLTQRLGERPSPQQIAAELGISERDVELVETALSGRDVTIAHADDAFDPRDESAGPEQAFAEREAEAVLCGQIRRALDRLSARERTLISEHLYAEDVQSLAHLGRELGVSRQRAGQILADARKKLRAELSCVA
jgi:RNA polymerase sigma-32 factor